jgi:hypothetical protein
VKLNHSALGQLRRARYLTLAELALAKVSVDRIEHQIRARTLPLPRRALLIRRHPMSRGQDETVRERSEFGHVYRRGDIYWIRYSVGGCRHRESTRSTSAREAAKLLARREAELGLGAFTSPHVKLTTFGDLAQIIRDEYVVNSRRSSDRPKCSLKQLGAAFAGARAATITLDRLTGYVRQQLEAGAAPGTVWNELKALRRAFRLAKRAGRVAHEPEFPELAGVDRVRTGFVEESDYRAVLAELPAPLQPDD